MKTLELKPALPELAQAQISTPEQPDNEPVDEVLQWLLKRHEELFPPSWYAKNAAAKSK